MSPTCSNCRFYLPVGGDRCCTRYPPSFQLVPHYEETPGRSWQIQPNVYDTITRYPMPAPDWPGCGEHQPAGEGGSPAEGPPL